MLAKTDRFYKSQKSLFGFDADGYITIFEDGMDQEDEWLMSSEARYCRLWGWYFGDFAEVPNDLPSEYKPVKLPWEIVGTENGTLKSETEVLNGLNELLYPTGNSKYVGRVGDRLELVLTVDRAKTATTKYGKSVCHYMSDEDGNIFVWATAAKDWPVGTIHHLRGTVKEQKDNINYLTRCMEAK